MTVDLVLKLLERVNNEVEHWGFAKDHHGHVAIEPYRDLRRLDSLNQATLACS